MNKRILLAFMIVLALVLSAGTIYASEVNVTDSYAAGTDSDDSIELGAYESDVENVLESENSNNLSTNTDESDVLSATVDVSKTVTAKDVTKYYKGSTKYTATFIDTAGNVLANTKVKIVVNGQNYTQKTDKKGVVSMDINLKPGSYKVSATNPKTGYTLTTTFKILNTISASDVSKVFQDTKKFSATFLKSNGKVLANKNVKFKVNGKTYTRKTNSKGVATLSLTSLSAGSYKIISYNTDGLTKTNTIKVIKKSKTTLTAKDYTFLTKDTKTIKVKLLNQFGYAPGSGKVIKIKIDGKSYSAKTNSKGVAKLKLPSLKAGTYTVTYKYAGNNYYYASSTSSKVTVISTSTPTFTVKSATTFGYGAGSSFKVALTSGSVPLAGQTVTLKVNGNTYTKTTDSSGIVSLPINLAVGKYTVTYTNKATSKIDSKTGSTEITVKQRTATTLTWKSATSLTAGTQSVSVALLDSSSKALSGQTVKLVVNSKTYTAKTASNGYATFSVAFTAGSYSATFSYAGDDLNLASSGSSKLTVTAGKTVTLKEIVTAANNFKKYYDSNNKFPSTVTVGSHTFTVPEFLYLMSQAISEIGNSKTSDVTYITGVSAPSSPSGDTISSAQLTKANYIKVASNVASFISTNKAAPNYASSAVGKIIYSELVDSFSRILAFYNNNDNTLPNYVVITYSSSSSSSQSGTGLNEKNTVSDLSIYLKSSTNCQVNNSAIKKVVTSLIKGLTTDKEKATAIYNYVRDSISYSFYYDTKYGAAGTLSSKTANCVDHSHLLVAMFRTAGLAARYVHGTCTFSSGSTYGHVWTQVLIGNTWTVADATSSRNSLGNIVNWNTKSFTLKGIYSGISF